MTRRFAITGLDGTGKTTLVRALGADPALRAVGVKTLHVPRHDVDPDLPLGRLGRVFDQIGAVADEQRDAALKAASMFAIMTLTGELERHLREAYAPPMIVSERQALVDSLVYARCYLPLLGRPLDRKRLEGALREVLTGADVAAADAWLAVVSRRTGLDCGLWALSETLATIFAQPLPDLLATLQTAYASTFPDELLVLTADEATFATRLAAKRAAAEIAEAHEDPRLLCKLQGALLQVADGLAHLSPRTRVHVLDVSGRDPETVLAAARGLIVGPEAGTAGATPESHGHAGRSIRS